MAQSLGTDKRQEDRVLINRLLLAYSDEMDDICLDSVKNRIQRHLSYFRDAYPNLRDIQGKKILDLACGSRANSNEVDGRFEPWACRLLLELGAIPVGVDIKAQRDEKFTSFILDLNDFNSLNIFEDGEFDGIYVSGFPTTDSVKDLQRKGKTWESQFLTLKNQCQRILKADGKFIRDLKEIDNFVQKVRFAPQIAISDDEL